MYEFHGLLDEVEISPELICECLDLSLAADLLDALGVGVVAELVRVGNALGKVPMIDLLNAGENQ